MTERNLEHHGETGSRRDPLPWGLGLCAGLIAVSGATHLVSVTAEFRPIAGLHRWLMTYAEGFHRRGLVGTVFQSLVGQEPREIQVALASQVSAAGTHLWAAAAFGLMLFAAFRTGNRPLIGTTLAYAAFAFVNPMWTTRAHDNGYLDWLAGLVVVGALVAFAYRRHVLAGTVVAIGIVAYWGTVFVWLPLGFLIASLLLRDVVRDHGQSPRLHRAIATGKSRWIPALLLPFTAALLAALLHDNDAAITELNRIGSDQAHIVQETFVTIPDALNRQADSVLANWRAYLGIGAVYVVPPALCAALWTGAMRRFGRTVFQPAWLDTALAVLATLSPLVFLSIAFDLSRLMAWTYFAFFVVAVFWLFEGPAQPDVRPARVWPWAAFPVSVAVLFWSGPTIYAWADLGYQVPCERFCFKERTPHGRALDRFRRWAIASPTLEYTADGGRLPGATGHVEGAPGGASHRVAREGRDNAGSLVDLDIRLTPQGDGVSVRAPAQTNNAIIGSGAHRLAVSYAASEVEVANAETRFTVYDSTLRQTTEILRARLAPSQTEFTATFTTPPELSGNAFRWEVLYSGKGVLELRRMSFARQDPEG